MKFTFKEYKIARTKNYVKTNNLFFFCNGINLSYNNWIPIEQNLKNLKISYYKVFNKTSIKKLKNSIYKNVTAVVNSVTFLLKVTAPSKELEKQIIINNIKHLFFDMLALNLNNKVYSKTQLKTMVSCNYKNNKLLLFQFNLTNLKLSNKKTINKTKIRNNVI